MRYVSMRMGTKAGGQKPTETSVREFYFEKCKFISRGTPEHLLISYIII